MTPEQKSALTKIAGEIIRREQMPSGFRDDWPKRLSWKEYGKRFCKMEEQCRGWALRIMDVVREDRK